MAKNEDSQFPDHAVGSIVRIRLRNFLTYSHAEFFPGPQMNMVIGPNGTGKSTIVCAIALGLGGGPSVLGRAKSLGDFIKHGETRSRIEIELKGYPKNLVIRRVFERTKGKDVNKWTIDGQNTTEVAVQRMVSKLKIQVDNLCQFLPQDKVASFAQMDAVKLLLETQRAAGKDTEKEQQSLADAQKELKGSTGSVNNLKEELKILQERNVRLERDVQKLNEAEKIQNEIEKVKAQIVYAKYQNDIDEYVAQKNTVQKLKRDYDSALEPLEPLRLRLREAEVASDNARANEKLEFSKFNESTSQLQVLSEEMEDFTKSHSKIQNDISSLKKRELDREQKLEAAEIQLEKMEDKLKSMGQNLIEKKYLATDGSVLNSVPRIVEIQKEIEDVYAELEDLENGHGNNIIIARQMQMKMREVSELVDEKCHQLQGLDNIRTQKLQLLSHDKHCYEAIKWLRNNTNGLKGRVYEPVILELNIRDPKYADLVEGSIAHRALTTFVCEEREDYYFMKSQVIEGLKLRINIATVDTNLESYTQNLDKEMIEKIGFDMYAIEALDGPEPVLAYLCQNANLHRLPVALRQLSERAQNEAEKHFARFSCGNDSFSVKKAYGAISTRGETLKKSKFLNSSVDLELKSRLESELEELYNSQKQQENRLEEINQLISKADTSKSRLKMKQYDFIKMADLENEKKRINNMILDYKKYGQTINQKKNLLDIEKNRPTMEQQIHEKRDELLDLNRERVKTCRRLTKTTIKGAEIYNERALTVFQFLESQCLMRQLTSELRDASDGIRSLEEQLQNAKSTLQDLKAVAKKSQAELNVLKQKYAGNDELLEIFETELPEDCDIEEFKTTLAELEARIDSISNIDPAILIEYQDREKEIHKKTAEVNTHEKRLSLLNEKLTVGMQEWKSKIETIISTINTSFSEYFSRIGCVGEVRLLENPDDFSKYGIEIWVKFRDIEELQKLDSHRQSGGERSVSTMLYLISLQSLSNSPFRVVDEINQGMDPRNERMIHKLIVESACEQHCSQYFLITPKLLPDLTYHRRMRVLCIFNGVWQPEKLMISDLVANSNQYPKRQKVAN